MLISNISDFILSHKVSFIFVIITLTYYYIQLHILEDKFSFPLSRFSTKTPYPFSNSKITDESIVNNSKLLRLVVLIRHSSRYPTESNIKQYDKTIYKLTQNPLSHNYKWVKAWINKFSLSQQGHLSSKGIQEATRLGRHYYLRYKHFFTDLAYPSQIIINSTFKERTISSSTHFMNGLFISRALQLTRSELHFDINSENDIPLRFFDMCKSRNNSSEQKKLFRAQFTSDIQPILMNISHKLGFEELTDQDVYTLWSLCQFEFVNFGQSRFCSLFSSKDALVLEKIEDNVHYSLNSNDQSFHGKISCPLLKNILQILTMTRGEDTMAAFYFAHAETLIPLFELFNISVASFENNTFPKSVMPEDHTYVYGLLSPMSANLAFLLYDSPEGKYYVKLKLNELDIYMGEARHGLVSLDYILNLYTELCYQDFETLCM